MDLASRFPLLAGDLSGIEIAAIAFGRQRVNSEGRYITAAVAFGGGHMQIKDTQTNFERRETRPLRVVMLCAVLIVVLIIAIALFRDYVVRQRGVDRNPHPPLVTNPTK